MPRAYKVVDVFTATPLLGNPVAVVLDAEGLDTHRMQAIAAWTNLSETTFVLPPSTAGADYRLRIFTPRSELPFAGHPTLGSAHAVLEAGRFSPRKGQLLQDCGVGVVELRVDGDGPDRRISLRLPPAKVTPLGEADIDELEGILGHRIIREARPAVIDVGAVWLVAKLARASDVIALKPDFARSAALERRLGLTGLSVFGLHERGEAAIETRSFAPSCGVDEDPVCGSGNGAIAVFQRERALLSGPASYVASQGQCVGRNGRVSVRIEGDGRIALGGACVTCVDGTIGV